MNPQANYRDEWLQKAFQLAYFIHRDRRTAIEVAVQALNKLEIASNAQFKRYYYTPTGRADTSRATRSRVSLGDLQLLQRLVLVESEKFERDRETARQTSAKDLLVHFIKHLVRITFKRNSFYVALGMTRILHNYGTAEAMDIYNVIVQDPERVHDDYYFRSRKGVLMKELKVRFEGLLETVKVNRGEERFESAPKSNGLTETVQRCLKFFTPWNSRCGVPEKFDPFSDVIESFLFDKKDPDEEHRIEINRIHAALHPDCFNRLTVSLKMPSSEEKLEIPKFMMNHEHADFDDQDWNDPSALEPDELAQIKNVLNAQAASRKAMSANLLRVVADGEETGRIDLDETDAVNFELGGGAELLEVRVVEKDGDLVLATHLLSFDELEKGRRTYSVRLEGGQKVSFDLDPQTDEYGEITGIKCSINYAETDWLKRFALFGRRVRRTFAGHAWLLKPALTFGALVLALTLGWLIFQKINIGEPQQVNVPEQQIIPIKSPETDNLPEKPQIAEKENAPINDENQPIMPKGEQKQVLAANKKPAVKKDLKPKPRIVLDAPQNQTANNNAPNRRTVADPEEIVRVPIRGNRQESNCDNCRQGNTRDANGKLLKDRGKSFAEVKTIYLELTGDEKLQAELRAELTSAVQSRTSFRVVTDKEQADAALKVSINADDAPNLARLTLKVSLVNEKGFVIFPKSKRISGWKYRGPASKLPARIADDLRKGK